MGIRIRSDIEVHDDQFNFTSDAVASAGLFWDYITQYLGHSKFICCMRMFYLPIIC